MVPLRLFLLIPVIIGNAREWNFGAYIATTNNNNVLTSVRIMVRDVDVIDLSSLGLVALDTNVFDHQFHKIFKLDLANNWLKNIPKFVFSNLTKLRHLSLADNDIKCCLENAFVGLTRLEVLDMRNNHLTHLVRNDFFGLSRSADILIKGNLISNVSTALFEINKPIYAQQAKIASEETAEASTWPCDSEKIKENKSPENNLKVLVKVCYNPSLTMNGLWVQRVDIWNTMELPKNCVQVDFNDSTGQLSLRYLGISNFDDNWYGLENLPISSIDLTGNRFTGTSRTISFLNNLPQNIKKVLLSVNYINYQKELDRPFIVIQNLNLRSLSFNWNNISAIDRMAFEGTNLTHLYLSDNNLSNLNFVESLSWSLVELDLHSNNIDNIPDFTFSNFYRLSRLILYHNKITTLSSQSLRGLISLRELDFMGNGLNTIEQGVFQDLKNLNNLRLDENSLSDIQKGLWNGLENIQFLDMRGNKLRNVTRNTLYALPDKLTILFLDRNNIEVLPKNIFVRVPTGQLSLNGNNISLIEDGCFNLPRLRELSLDNNRLRTFKSWGNLEGLKKLSLVSNNITTIEKGATKFMFRLKVLDLSGNPIKSLENDALPDLSKNGDGVVHLNDVPLEIIQGGVFDN